MQTWTDFRCNNPDCVVKSVIDNVEFPANRKAMQNSEVFRDMFDMVGESNAPVELHEPSASLIILLRLLHFPPSAPVIVKSKKVKDYSEEAFMTTKRPKDIYEPTTVIPFPILMAPGPILELADKYVLNEPILNALYSHLLVHAETNPLPIYAYATEKGLEELASHASEYLMPIGSYRLDEIGVIPNVKAYHKVVRLQDLRSKELKALLLKENLFPYGYRACPQHEKEATALWIQKRLELATELSAVTDVAAEMGSFLLEVPQKCPTCYKAGSAAVNMLAYKSHRILRRIDQLPPE